MVGKVSKPLKNATFIIHKAAEVCGKITGKVERINYYLAFLDKHADRRGAQITRRILGLTRLVDRVVETTGVVRFFYAQ